MRTERWAVAWLAGAVLLTGVGEANAQGVGDGLEDSGGADAAAVTVSSLLAEGFTIEGVMPSNAGPGLLLLKGTDLWMCFVAETPSSPEIATQYCKPVR